MGSCKPNSRLDLLEGFDSPPPLIRRRGWAPAAGMGHAGDGNALRKPDETRPGQYNPVEPA